MTEPHTNMSDFLHHLSRSWTTTDSLLCVGLDPDPRKLPLKLRGHPGSVFTFCREIVDATAGLACAYKPQAAYFHAQAAEDDLAEVIRHIHQTQPGVPVILDAKRGDIGPTAEQYACEAFSRYGADAVTVNPYMGSDALEPFLRDPRKGVFVLCRTSNPGAADFQSLITPDGRRLFQVVADRAAQTWNTAGNVGLVIGATWPAELADARGRVGPMPILGPGIGAQGGDLEAVLRNGLDANGAGLLINASRSILYASEKDDFAAAAREAAATLGREIRALRSRLPRAPQ